MRRLEELLKFASVLQDTKVTVVDGIWTVTIGSQMADWQKHQLITRFRSEFKSCDIKITAENGVNISGETTMKTRF